MSHGKDKVGEAHDIQGRCNQSENGDDEVVGDHHRTHYHQLYAGMTIAIVGVASRGND